MPAPLQTVALRMCRLQVIPIRNRLRIRTPWLYMVEFHIVFVDRLATNTTEIVSLMIRRMGFHPISFYLERFDVLFPVRYRHRCPLIIHPVRVGVFLLVPLCSLPPLVYLNLSFLPGFQGLASLPSTRLPRTLTISLRA